MSDDCDEKEDPAERAKLAARLAQVESEEKEYLELLEKLETLEAKKDEMTSRIPMMKELELKLSKERLGILEKLMEATGEEKEEKMAELRQVEHRMNELNSYKKKESEGITGMLQQVDAFLEEEGIDLEEDANAVNGKT